MFDFCSKQSKPPHHILREPDPEADTEVQGKDQAQAGISALAATKELTIDSASAWKLFYLRKKSQSLVKLREA